MRTNPSLSSSHCDFCCPERQKNNNTDRHRKLLHGDDTPDMVQVVEELPPAVLKKRSEGMMRVWKAINAHEKVRRPWPRCMQPEFLLCSLFLGQTKKFSSGLCIEVDQW
jgi:hypothetical protein